MFTPDRNGVAEGMRHLYRRGYDDAIAGRPSTVELLFHLIQRRVYLDGFIDGTHKLKADKEK